MSRNLLVTGPERVSDFFAKTPWQKTQAIAKIATYCQENHIYLIRYNSHFNKNLRHHPAFADMSSGHKVIGIHENMRQSFVVPALLHEIGHHLFSESQTDTDLKSKYECAHIFQWGDLPLTSLFYKLLIHEEMEAWRLGKELSDQLEIPWQSLYSQIKSFAVGCHKKALSARIE